MGIPMMPPRPFGGPFEDRFSRSFRNPAFPRRPGMMNRPPYNNITMNGIGPLLNGRRPSLPLNPHNLQQLMQAGGGFGRPGGDAGYMLNRIRNSGGDWRDMMPYGYNGYGGGFNGHGMCNCIDCLVGFRRRGSRERLRESVSTTPSVTEGKSTKLPFKTKDIVVRGKAYAVRKSFLEDQSKFESELTKYMSGKSEKIIPENVIDHLIDLINDQEFQAKSISDLVTLNILASNLSSKSCSSASLKKLKDDYKLYNDFSKPELCVIIATILKSDCVSDGLKGWLKDMMKEGGRMALHDNPAWDDLVIQFPEVELGLHRLMGWQPEGDSDAMLRIQCAS